MFCPFCGVEIPNSSSFCGFCGKKIPVNEDEIVSEPVQEAVSAVSEAVSEPVQETVSAVSEAVPEPVQEVVSAVSEAVSEPVQEAVSAVSEAVSEPVQEAVSAVSEAVSEPVQETVSTVSEAVSEPVQEVVSAVSEAVSEPVQETVSAVSEAVFEPVQEVVSGVSEAVSEPVQETVSAVSETVPEPVRETVSAANEAVPNPSESLAAGEGASGHGTSENVQPGGSVVFTQPEDAAFEGLEDDKGVKARRAFSMMALLKNKLFLICAGAVLVFIVLISIIIGAISSSANKNPLKGAYYSVRADGETVFLYNGNLIKGTDFSTSCAVSATSYDGTTALVVDKSTLSILSNGKVTKIADDLSKDYAALSANGKTAVYINDDELTSYSNGKKTKICELENTLLSYFVVSPDGGTVVYADYNEDGSFKSVGAWKGGNVIDLDAKFSPVMVSNGGKMVYGIDNSGNLVYIKNLKPGSDGKIKNVSKIVDQTEDNSGIVYLSGSNTYYFDASASEPIKITGKSITVVNEGSYSISHKNFKNFYAVSGTGVYKFTKKKDDFESDKIISGASRVRLSEDGKTFIYKDGDELVKVSASNPDKENVIADEVYTYSCDPSLKYVYYLDEDGDLRYASSKKAKICSDVSSYVVNYSGVCVFTDEDGNLYYSSKGGEKSKVSGIYDVESINIRNGIVYVRADDRLYSSANGKKFQKTGVDF